MGAAQSSQSPCCPQLTVSCGLSAPLIPTGRPVSTSHRPCICIHALCVLLKAISPLWLEGAFGREQGNPTSQWCPSAQCAWGLPVPQLPEERTPFLRQQPSATSDIRLRIISQFCHFLAVVSDSLHKRSGPQFPHVQNTHNLFPRGPEKRPHMLLSPSEITMQLPTFDHFLQK